MAFNVEITFSGLVAVVPGTNAAGAFDKICFVTPNGRLAENAVHVGLDGQILERHRTYCRFQLDQLVALQGSEVGTHAEGVWYLDRERVTFHLGPSPNLTLPNMADPTGHLNRIPRMESLFEQTTLPVPATGLLDPQCFAASPNREEIGNQIWLTHGDCELAQDRLTQASWRIEPRFGPDIQLGKIAHHLRLTFKNVDSFEMRAVPFASPANPPRRLQLAPASPQSPTVKLSLVNFCDENPLEWPRPDLDAEPDNDFRWYYSLLAEPVRSWVVNNITTLGGERLLPRPVAIPGGGKAGGPNCNKILFQTTRFDKPF